jgi:hypothetical protein
MRNDRPILLEKDYLYFPPGTPWSLSIPALGNPPRSFRAQNRKSDTNCDPENSPASPSEVVRDSNNMASSPASPAPSGKKEEEEADLTTLLSEAHQKDLTLLIAEITASMRKSLVDNFDPITGLILEIKRHPKKLNADERMTREKKLKQQYDEETAKPATKSLKKDAIAAFDEWRKTVILRVGEALKTQDFAKELLDQPAKDSASTSTAAAAAATDDILKFKDMFPPTKTPLTKLKMNERTLVLHSLLLLLLGLEHYNAPSRVLLLHLTSSLKLPLKTFEQDEYATAKG